MIPLEYPFEVFLGLSPIFYVYYLILNTEFTACMLEFNICFSLHCMNAFCSLQTLKDKF